MTADNTPGMLRVRGANDRVTFMELFFDLVYVFAVTQLSHLLVANLSWQGAGQTLLLLLAVWWAWLNTAWFTNWYDPEQRLVRVVLVGCMLAGLVMSASIPDAFGSRGAPFAIGYAVLSVGRNAFAAAFVRDDPPLRRNLQRVLAWAVFAGVLWIAGGLAQGAARELIWCLAIVVDYSSALLRFYTPGLGRSALEDWTIDGGHLAERCHLVIMIALGESVLVIGGTLSASAGHAAESAAFAVEFVGAVALWWLYFDRSAGAAGQRILSERVPGRLARSAYTYMHAALVAGIILFAVGDHLVIAHPGGRASWAVGAVIVGGPMVFLAGHGLFVSQVFERVPVERICGVAVLAVLALGTPFVSPLVLTTGCVVVILAVCLADEAAGRSKIAHRSPALTGDQTARNHGGMVSMYEHVGGEEPLRRFVDLFYSRVLADPVLKPLFGDGEPHHVDHLTAFEAEAFGGPERYTKELGGFQSIIDVHRHLRITEEQRQRFIALYLAAADDSGLPSDEAFRSALRTHVEFGTEVAMQNSHARTDDELHPLREVPKWTWDGDGES